MLTRYGWKAFLSLPMALGIASLTFAQDVLEEKFTQHHILIDTDMMSDDLFALLYLLNQNDIVIEGISVTSSGESGMQMASQLISNFPEKGIPLIYGEQTTFIDGFKFNDEEIQPILPFNSTDSNQHQSKFDVERYPKFSTFLCNKLSEFNSNLVILALGPLTSIAKFFLDCPEGKHKIKKIISMSGAFNVQGNCDYLKNQLFEQYAEYNVFQDPRALQFILDSGVPIDFISLDATYRLPLNSHFFKKDRNIEFINKLLHLISRLNPELKNLSVSALEKCFHYGFFCDPLAAIAVNHSNLFHFVPICLGVVTEEDKDRQMGSLYLCNGANNARYVPYFNPELFEKIFLSGMLN